MNNNLVRTAEASSRIDTSGMNMGFGTLLGVYVRVRAGKYSRFGPRPLNPKPCSCCPWHAIVDGGNLARNCTPIPTLLEGS